MDKNYLNLFAYLMQDWSLAPIFFDCLKAEDFITLDSRNLFRLLESVYTSGELLDLTLASKTHKELFNNVDMDYINECFQYEPSLPTTFFGSVELLIKQSAIFRFRQVLKDCDKLFEANFNKALRLISTTCFDTYFRLYKIRKEIRNVQQ